MPDTARMCVVPVTAKASNISSESDARSPSNSPDSRAFSGNGRNE
jgi:hypothetical protein